MDHERSRSFASSSKKRPHLRLLSPVRLDKPSWSKALWKRHLGYEDNYVPPDFLASTRVKFEGQKNLPSLRAIAIRQAVPQTTFTSFISLVISVFRSLLDGIIGPSDLVLLCAVSCICLRLGFKAYIWWFRTSLPLPMKQSANSAQLSGSANYILPPFLLYLCSPLLLSLTKATTSDSIWPLAGGLFILSSILGGFGSDYQEEAKSVQEDAGMSALSPVAPTRTTIMSPAIRQEMRKRRPSGASLDPTRGEVKREKAKILQSCLSVTSCLSACIVLASRLGSSWEVFSLLTFVGLAMGSLIWLSRPVIPLSTRILVAVGLQSTAVLACYFRSAGFQDMPSSPEGALIMLNLALCVSGPILIQRASRWHVG